MCLTYLIIGTYRELVLLVLLLFLSDFPSHLVEVGLVLGDALSNDVTLYSLGIHEIHAFYLHLLKVVLCLLVLIRSLCSNHFCLGDVVDHLFELVHALVEV